MPWCESCSHFWTPTSMAEDGSCPTCGAKIATAQHEPSPGAPWHFKLLVVAMVIYLVWRTLQVVGWFV